MRTNHAEIDSLDSSAVHIIPPASLAGLESARRGLVKEAVISDLPRVRQALMCRSSCEISCWNLLVSCRQSRRSTLWQPGRRMDGASFSVWVCPDPTNPRGAERPVTKTRAPYRASSHPTPRLTPLLAPVPIATLPCTFISVILPDK